MSFLRKVVSSSFPAQVLGFSKRPFKSFRFPGESLDDSSSPSISHGIHVFHCPDEVGIVAKLSECIASRGGNILKADVFVPEDKNVFYSRRSIALPWTYSLVNLSFTGQNGPVYKWKRTS